MRCRLNRSTRSSHVIGRIAFVTHHHISVQMTRAATFRRCNAIGAFTSLMCLTPTRSIDDSTHFAVTRLSPCLTGCPGVVPAPFGLCATSGRDMRVRPSVFSRITSCAQPFAAQDRPSGPGPPEIQIPVRGLAAAAASCTDAQVCTGLWVTVVGCSDTANPDCCT